MSLRWIVLPASALVIAGLCAWKMSQPQHPVAAPRFAPGVKSRAPDFELSDQGKDLGEGRTEPSKSVRLKAYLGRHAVALAFFDGDQGADLDPTLALLRTEHEALDAAGVRVLAVTTALPQTNRRAIGRSGEFPFPLLSDPSGAACKDWGVLSIREDDTLATRPALFLIDRAGNVEFRDGRPHAESNPDAAIDALLRR